VTLKLETRVVRIAFAVISVAVLDDAFVHLEPGTSIADHLASGLIPITVAVVLAVVYPRLRPGLRGLTGLVCGTLAIVAGIVDTALLSAAAGAALFAVGAIVLWQSRRLDERPLRRYGRRGLVGVVGLIGVYLVVLPLAFALVANHKVRSPVSVVDLGRTAQRVQLTTRDGLALVAWYVPSRNRAAVIVFPGHEGPVPHARMLVRHGYGALMVDRRGEGASEGDYNARGWGGELDLEAAIDFLSRTKGVDPQRIGGLGLSVGGELLLQTAAQDQRLRAVVSEGAGEQSLNDQMQIPDVPKALRWLSPMTVETAAGVVLANRWPPSGLAGVVPRIAPRPVLLISGGSGNADEELNAVYRAAGGPTVTQWEIPQASHTGGLAAEPREYERRVVGFFDAALGRH
jgi:fermentation-respiration switch protein FrsA (DUF1100 family)